MNKTKLLTSVVALGMVSNLLVPPISAEEGLETGKCDITITTDHTFANMAQATGPCYGFIEGYHIYQDGHKFHIDGIITTEVRNGETHTLFLPPTAGDYYDYELTVKTVLDNDEVEEEPSQPVQPTEPEEEPSQPVQPTEPEEEPSQPVQPTETKEEIPSNVETEENAVNNESVNTNVNAEGTNDNTNADTAESNENELPVTPNPAKTGDGSSAESNMVWYWLATALGFFGIHVARKKVIAE